MTNKTEKQNIRKKKNRAKTIKTGFYYSFLTLGLIFCLCQIGWGAIINISKIISYQGKVIVLERVLKQAQATNEDLKSEKKVITSDKSLEEIARNNLKMAGKNEVLIIINKRVEEPKPKKSKFNWEFFKKKSKEELKEEEYQKTYIPEEVVEE